MKRFDLNEATKQDLDIRFNYHAPDDDRRERHEALRAKLKTMAEELSQLVPAGRERSLAITHLEEAMFWGNAGIARSAAFKSPPPPHGGPAAHDGSSA